MMALWHTVPCFFFEEAELRKGKEAKYPIIFFLHIPKSDVFQKTDYFLGFLLRAGDELY